MTEFGAPLWNGDVAQTLVFKVTFRGRAKYMMPVMTPKEQEENVVDCIMDGLGFPENIEVTAELVNEKTP